MSTSGMQFKLVSTPEEANADAMIVTLFLCPMNKVRGWFVGPIALLRGGLSVPYVPRSALMLGITAVVRAHRLANEQGLAVFIVDPDKLWSRLIAG